MRIYDQGLDVLVRGRSLVVRAVSLGDERAAVLVVLEASTDHHHGQGTSQHAVHLARDLVAITKLLARQEGSESTREASVDKVVKTDKERARANNSGAQNDHMALDKEREDDTDDDADNDKDGAANSRRNDAVLGPGENEDGKVESTNGTDGSESEAPETNEECAS